MSRNAKPAEGALDDQTLRRSGVRDWSGENEAGNSQSYPVVDMDIDQPTMPSNRPWISQDVFLHLGRPPERIDRQHEARLFGMVSPSGQGGYNPRRHGEYMRVGHVPMEHPVTMPGGQPIPGNAYDDALPIPSFRIGDPI